MTFYVALLHSGMHDKAGAASVTTSITPIDVHDIARSCRTYGVAKFLVVHPAPSMRKLARTLLAHWLDGYGASYNPNRREAISYVHLVEDLDEAISAIAEWEGALPTIVATSAHDGEGRCSFAALRAQLTESTKPHLMLLGTGWGMNNELLARADLLLEPIRGVPQQGTTYNHLSVRGAAAILLDRLLGGDV